MTQRRLPADPLGLALARAALIFAWSCIAALGVAGEGLPEEPGAPEPGPAVVKALDEAKRLAVEGRNVEALERSTGAREAALAAADVVGAALASTQRAAALEALERRDEARTAWEESEALWERANDGPGQIDALAAQAALLARESKEDRARRVERAIHVANVETRRPLATAGSLGRASRRLVTAGRLDEAKEIAEAALSLAGRRAPESLLEAEVRSSLANAIREKGDLAGARAEYTRALAIQERLAPDSRSVALTLNGLGLVAFREGNLDAAQADNERALRIQEKEEPGSLAVAQSLSNLGIVAWTRGDLARARELLERALDIRQKKAPGTLAVAQGRNNLGILAYTRGDLDAAREFYESALRIFAERARDSLDYARCLSNLGVVLRDQGDSNGAREHYLRALEIKERQAPGSLDVASSLNKLGVLATDQRDFEGARDYLLRALAIFTRLAPDSASVAWALNNLGVAFRDHGDLEAGRDYFLRSLEIKEKVAPGSLDLASTLNNVGDVLAKQGKSSEARSYLRRALEIRERQAPSSVELAETLKDLGNLARSDGDLPEAVRSLTEAWEIVRRQRGAVSGDEAGRAFTTYFAAYPNDLAAAEMAAGRVEDAFETHEEGRAQTLLRILAERGIEERVPDPALWRSYVAAEESFEQAAKDLEEAGEKEAKSAAARAGESTEPDKAGARVAREKALETYTQSRLVMEASFVRVRRSVPGLDVGPVGLRKAREALPAGSLFLAFSVGSESSVLFVVHPGADGKVEAFRLAPGEATLAARVASLRAAIEGEGGVRGIGGLTKTAEPGPADGIVAAGRALFESLFPAEVRSALLAASRWIVSPDGPLWDLPFAALATESGHGRPGWLGLRTAISYAPSLTVFALDQARERSSRVGGALVVGDPVLGRPPTGAETAIASTRFRALGAGAPPEPLPFARQEAIRIARLYGVEPIVGAAATEAAVRSRLPSARIVHLATHGYFHPRLAMSSGVVLAPPEKEPERRNPADDGSLQAWELNRSLPLEAELVVLSACETGRGEKVPGEGVIGLTRSLLGVGARSVVATQWSVADRASSALMVSFHTKLLAGLPKDEALRNAMREVAKAKATSHPFYWAGFFLMGDPNRAITGQ